MRRATPACAAIRSRQSACASEAVSPDVDAGPQDESMPRPCTGQTTSALSPASAEADALVPVTGLFVDDHGPPRIHRGLRGPGR